MFLSSLSALLAQKEADINELKSKIAEVMALVPSSTTFSTPGSASPPHFSAPFARPDSREEERVLVTSTLNPNASDYTPKLTD